VKHDVRPAAVAGTFYPASPHHLLKAVDDLLARAKAPASSAPPKALIVPHAGYVYSGPVAASAYAAIEPHASRFTRVVLLGPAHREYVRGLALPEATAFETPLGVVEIEPRPAQDLPGVVRSDRVHAREHSLEVELPFLVRVLHRFRVVPLAVGEAEGDEVARVIEALWGGPETLVVVSSDLSHYLPYDAGRALDEATTERILGLGPAAVLHEQACGATPINGLLAVAKQRNLRPALLDLASSGDTAGDRGSVVGYGAFAFYEEGADAPRG
jgi:AmmeMemoRadiSam system protein B